MKDKQYKFILETLRDLFKTIVQGNFDVIDSRVNKIEKELKDTEVANHAPNHSQGSTMTSGVSAIASHPDTQSKIKKEVEKDYL